MNATELMTGDYFYRPDCIDRVVEIRKNGVIGTDSLRGLICWSEIKPITLTPEILEKNGFEYDHSFHTWIYDEFTINHGYLIEEDYNEHLFVWVADVHVVITYVHELQHILRLCGQNDLADNFSV